LIELDQSSVGNIDNILRQRLSMNDQCVGMKMTAKNSSLQALLKDGPLLADCSIDPKCIQFESTLPFSSRNSEGVDGFA
jgi:hypothetical protein